jgi:type IV pilus assembly protein PilM
LAIERLIEMLPNKGVDTLVALFEIGAFTTSLQVLRNDEILYERDQAFGGAQLTQLIVRQYGFSSEEAEVKKRSGDLPEDYEVSVLRPFVENMAQETTRALQFFFNTTPHSKVGHIFLAGGAAAMPGLVDTVSKQSACSCSVVNPFEGMEIGGSVRSKRLSSEAPSYLTACGLAMRRFSL